MKKSVFICVGFVCFLGIIFFVRTFINGDMDRNDTASIQRSRSVVPEASQEVQKQGALRPSLTLNDRLQQGDVENGRKVFKQCVVCHTSGRDQPNRIGPALWDIVNRPFASVGGFAYSRALRANLDKRWDFVALDHYIRSPRKTIPGTTMSFRGVKDDQDRADLLLYLRSLSDNPVPLPMDR